MQIIYKIVCVLILIICLVIEPSAQTKQTKDQILEIARLGQFQKLSPAEIRQKFKEMGITEEEAIRKAKEYGVDLTKYLQDANRETPLAVTPSPFISTEIPSPMQSLKAEEIPTLAPDTTPIPRGPYGLEYFGYEVFRNIPEAFEPTAVGPIDPGYLVGAGDIVRLTVWGQAEFQYELEVDREGRVFIPNVGQVFIMGTPLEKLEQKLKNQLSKYYSGLASSPPTVFMDVTIAKLRPLRVFVMGEVAKPGGYIISSYATVFNSLYAVGGPLIRGSLRAIKVFRENKFVTEVDLYDYLLRGDKSGDVRLQNNDLIFVPPRQKTVSIRGAVFRPAVYELKQNEHLDQLLDYCGGLLPEAYLINAQIDRIKPFQERTEGVFDKVIVDVNLTEVINKKTKVPLYDGDEMEVFSILDQKRNYVYIWGPVWRPGRYELGSIKTVLDLIKVAEGLQPKTYTEIAHLVRYNEDLITKRILPIPLKAIMNNESEDIKLMPRDEVLVFSTEVVEVKKHYVTIRGEVKQPGIYPLYNNMTLADLIMHAGGYTEEAEVLEAEVSRILPQGLSGDSLAIIFRPKLTMDFTKSDSSNSAPNFLLMHRDEVLIRPNPNYQLQQNVCIRGEINYPGTYSLKHRGERLSELLERAGGPTSTSYLGGAQFFRGKRRLLIDFNEAYYKKNKIHDVIMLPGDSIYIFPKPHTVYVAGQVNNPGYLSFIEGDKVSHYIERAGGLTDSASYALLSKPTGETQKVYFGLFRANPEVLDGSTINVLKIPPEPPEKARIDVGLIIKESFAILTSAATVAFIVWQVSK